MKLLFEWDAAKARSNFRKLGITFEEAATVFGDPRAITIKSDSASDEARFATRSRRVRARDAFVPCNQKIGYRLPSKFNKVSTTRPLASMISIAF